MTEAQRKIDAGNSDAGEMTHQKDALNPLRDLPTMRMISFFSMLRRGTVLAQRRHFGLSEIEWRIMTHVAEHAPLSLNGLAEVLLQDRGQLSRAVKSMVERGLLTRERKPGGPEIEIELAPDGRALHARMVDLVIERDAKLTEGIGADDIKTLRRLMDLMIVRAFDMTEEEQRLLPR